VGKVIWLPNYESSPSGMESAFDEALSSLESSRPLPGPSSTVSVPGPPLVPLPHGATRARGWGCPKFGTHGAPGSPWSAGGGGGEASEGNQDPDRGALLAVCANVGTVADPGNSCASVTRCHAGSGWGCPKFGTPWRALLTAAGRV